MLEQLNQRKRPANPVFNVTSNSASMLPDLNGGMYGIA